MEELAEVVRKAEGGNRGRSGSRKGSPLTHISHLAGGWYITHLIGEGCDGVCEGVGDWGTVV